MILSVLIALVVVVLALAGLRSCGSRSVGKRPNTFDGRPHGRQHVAAPPPPRAHLIRAIVETRWDKATRPIAKETLRRAIEERKKIRREGWFS